PVTPADEACRQSEAICPTSRCSDRHRGIAADRTTIARLDADPEPGKQIVMRAQTVAQRCDRRVRRAARSQSVATDAEESVRREAEQQGLHHRDATKRLEEDIGVRCPAAEIQTGSARVVAVDGPDLTGADSTRAVIVRGCLLGTVASTDIQSAADAETEDAGVASEAHAAEGQINRLL